MNFFFFTLIRFIFIHSVIGKNNILLGLKVLGRVYYRKKVIRMNPYEINDTSIRTTRSKTLCTRPFFIPETDFPIYSNIIYFIIISGVGSLDSGAPGKLRKSAFLNNRCDAIFSNI